MNYNLEGKKILVTGAGQGIGRALAKKLASCQVQVVAISNVEEELNSLKDESPQILTVTMDVTSPEIKDIIENFGPFDGLVNNAAVAILEPFLDYCETNFDRQFNINVKAPMFIGQQVAKQMIRHSIQGSIVNISSQAAKIALYDHVVYCGTKAALDAATRVMALELGQYRIRVNSVNPTVIMTEMGKRAWENPEKALPMLNRIPLGRFGEVEDVINAVLFLLSDNACFINAVTLPVDGGFLAC